MQFFESYIERLGSDVVPPPEIILGSDGLETVARRISSLPAGTGVWIISDENTDAAFPLRAALSSLASSTTPASERRVAACSPLPGTPRVVPDDFLVERITCDVIAAKAGLVVAIGGGTISDIAKRVSYLAGVPNWCVATAPSVDAYTSAKSAIRVDGYHNGIPATPSSLVVCDVDVMAAAPQVLFLSGVGDLTAKYFAYLEWFIASLVTGEPYSEREASFALDSARRAVAAFQSLPSGARPDAAAARALGDAVLTSGLAMRAAGNSRPAAAAEHTIAHFWEMAGVVGVESYDYHGLLVAIAAATVFPFYVGFFDELRRGMPDPDRDVVEPYDHLSSLDRLVAPYRAKMIAETGGPVPIEERRRRVARFLASAESIIERVETLLPELEAAIGALGAAGFPLTPASAGISAEAVTTSLRYVPYLRDRFGMFDLILYLGWEDRLGLPSPAGR